MTSVDRHRRLMELFDEAVDLSAAKQQSYMEKVRADDGELAELLAALLLADRSATTVPATPIATRSERPKMIGDYKVIRLLGEGGMGAVYEADQAQPKRRVAVKVLHAASATVRRRFELEIEALAALDHPNIARIYEAGEANGALYFAMELVSGETLNRYVRQVNARARVALIARICDAVQHAHAKGVIHRDLKPANILVDAAGAPKILDFGIARVATAAGKDETITGMLAGTPRYMSPEQAALSEIDARSDVYVLGVLLYEVIAGQLPYAIEVDEVQPILRAIREDPPRRAPELAGDLEVIAHKALAKDPDERYATAAALADDLRHWLSDEDIAARPPSTRTQVRRFVRKHRALAASIVAIAASILVGGILSLAMYARADRARVALADENRALVLANVKAELEVDPTEAVRLLRQLPPGPIVDELGRRAEQRGVSRHVLMGHTAEVRWVAFLPDGKSLVSASYDHTVRVWDLDSGSAHVLADHATRVSFAVPAPNGTVASGGPDGIWIDARSIDTHATAAVAWSPDGAVLAAASGNVVRLFPTETTLAGSKAALENVAWSPGGKTVAATATDGGVWIWDVATGTARELAGHTGEATELAWFDDTTLLTGARDGQLRAWNATTGAATVLESEREIKAIACTAGTCAWADRGGRITIWDGKNARHPAGGHNGPVRALVFSPGGDTFATCGDDHEVRLWDATTGATRVLLGHRARVRMVAFSRDGTQLASGADDGVVRVWRVASPRRFAAHDGATNALAWAPDGSSLASGGGDGEVRTWRADGTPLRSVGTVAEGVSAIAFAGPDKIVSGGREHDIKVWELGRTDFSLGKTWSIEYRWSARVIHLDVCGERVVVASLSHDVAVVNLTTAVTLTLQGHTARVNDARCLSDGRIVSASSDATVRVWDAAGNGQIALTFDDDVRVLAVGPHGRVAAGGYDGTVRTWPDGAVIEIGSPITALAFAGDDIVAGTRDGAIHRGGAVIGRHTSAVTALAVAADGTLLSAGDDDRAIAWEPGGPRVLGEARRLALDPSGMRVAGGGEDGSVGIWAVHERPVDLDALTSYR